MASGWFPRMFQLRPIVLTTYLWSALISDGLAQRSARNVSEVNATPLAKIQNEGCRAILKRTELLFLEQFGVRMEGEPPEPE